MNRITSHLSALAGAVICLAAAAPADAAPPRSSLLADSDVRELVSTTNEDGLLRGLVLEDGRDTWLVVEAWDLDRRRRLPRTPTVQTRVDSVRFERGPERSLRGVEAFENLRWKRDRLVFDAIIRGERLSCRVQLEGRNAFTAMCADLDGHRPGDPGHPGHPSRPDRPDRPHGPPPVPVAVNHASRPEVIRACGDAFFSSGDESKCLDIVRDYAFDPVGYIAACDRHLFDDAATLRCLRIGHAAAIDPQPVLSACDRAMFSDNDALTCVTKAIEARWEPSAMVGACDSATFSDNSAIACIEAAVRAPADPTPAIAACDRASSGDEAVLACVRRATR